MPPKGSGKKQQALLAQQAALAAGLEPPPLPSAPVPAARERPTATSSVPYAPQGDYLLRYTTFNVIGFLNGKNVSSTYAKNDAQSYWARRPNEEAMDKQRDGKRRRLMASEEELEEGTDAVTVLAKGDARAPKPKSAVQPDSPTSNPDDEVDELSPRTVDPSLKTLVIHPGSSFLRIGRASDAFPITIPNVIASKRTSTMPATPTAPAKGKAVELPSVGLGVAMGGADLPAAAKAVEQSQLDPQAGEPDAFPSRDAEGGEEDVDMLSDGGSATSDLAPLPSDSSDPVAAKIASIRGDLRARMRLFKLRGTTNAAAQAIAYNEAVRQEKVQGWDEEEGGGWTDVGDGKGKEFYVGDEALAIADPEATGYIVRRPYDRGQFNTQGYSSSQEFLGDVERIWTTALEKEMGISREELKEYSVIFIIPDLYDQVYIREMVNLILDSLGFKQVLLQQESICATFGAGLSTACVIDIGAKKTSISCIEEGLILPETRMLLDFAGADVTTFLHTLLARTGFPYKEVDLGRSSDWKMLEELKEKLVVLSEADVGLNLYDFFVRRQGQSTFKYSMRVYDDCILAPYALFAPRVVDFDAKRAPEQTLWSKDVDDVVEIGGGVVTNVMKNSTRHLVPVAPAALAPGTLSVPVADESPSLATTPLLEEPAPASHHPSHSPNPSTAAAAPSIDVRVEASKLPLDVAVVESILAAGTEDRMKKLCGNILIVGGTGRIHNIGFAVESRVGPALAARAPSLNGHTAVVPCPSGVDPRELAWKGVGTLCRLEVANELWIRKEDWERFGLRGLRDRGWVF